MPSVNAILNFATEFFEMLTKKQSEHLQTVFQVFQVFRVFQVFHFAFWPQNRPVLVQIRTKPEKSVLTHLRHKMDAENPQKGNSLTGLQTRSCPASYRRWFFRRSRLFILFHPSKPHHLPQIKQHSLLVLTSVHTIINFATEVFEMFTKKQSEHPQTVFQVFQVFRVFQVFHFAFGPQNSPILVQIRTKPTNRQNHPTAI